jgi:hypothetical protein
MPYDHRTVRGLLSAFFHCILLKKLDFKSKPDISVQMRPLVLVLTTCGQNPMFVGYS